MNEDYDLRQIEEQALNYEREEEVYVCEECGCPVEDGTGVCEDCLDLDL